MNFNELKEYLINYLEDFRQAEINELKQIEQLSDVEKEEKGFAVYDAPVISKNDDFVELSVTNNLSRWRMGDKVICKSTNSGEHTATVFENYVDRIVLTDIKGINVGDKINIYSDASELTGIIIGAIKRVKNGGTGSNYLEVVGGLSEPEKASPFPLSVESGFCDNLNEKQREAVERIIKRPSVYTIQGPPGTGKTNVLATIAHAFSKKGKSVLVISNSHQAVNNALNKIVEKDVPVYKIGSEYKTQALHSRVISYESMKKYNISKRLGRRQQKNSGDILGMTLYGAIINLILHNSEFTPAIVLVDEASQIPLAMGAAIAKIGAGTNVFIGDERQMPPIFPKEIVNHELSKSIFEHLQKTLPVDLKTILTVSYRMNKVVCDYVSSRYYEPYGIILSSFPQISDRHVCGEELSDSVQVINIDSQVCLDRNEIEALKAVELADYYLSKGLDVAVVTPYRKQVNCVIQAWNTLGGRNKIIIDTVERMQGLDVDVIIVTMSCSEQNYYFNQKEFLLNPNRLNVMTSRAKQKVVIIKSPIIAI